MPLAHAIDRRYTAAMHWLMQAILLTIVIQLASCNAPAPTIADPLEVAPADFYIDATVMAVPASRSPDAARAIHYVPVQLRPARYVLFADGTLRHDVDPTGDRGADWLPPITRILTREQTAQTWSLAKQLGLTDPKKADPIINPNLVTASLGERVIFMDFRGDSQRWNFLRRAPLDQPPDAALEQLLRHLAQLSWADQDPAPDALIMPKRYDFGPDPYERYRNPSPQK
jgi:hypothetical protein